ncbi:MAG TPA: FAD-dependent oxidoreductase, partial [Streptosporangiaceae bacterium]|nr:FAD-dependent oxidoreductase [Streptosporangiaceae bacterium]
MTLPRHAIAILGGGPGGYEAALVAAQLGANVTLVEEDGPGGACVLTDCVPSKTLIETSNAMTQLRKAPDLGICGKTSASTDPGTLYQRIKHLAEAQSTDITSRLEAENIRIIRGKGEFTSHNIISTREGDVHAETILIATGAHPRTVEGSEPDGERILTLRQLYDLDELPENLIVIGSGVTGAEFASAYQALGSHVTLVSSRQRVLPHEDEDAAALIEQVWRRRGMTVLGQSRGKAVTRDKDSVTVTLQDGSQITGTHCLMT